jgi:hypothetical protein
MILPAVVYDTNVYRGLSDERFGRLVELERRRGVARFVDPVVLTELLAHLLDSDETEQRSCRAAIGRAYRRSEGYDGLGGIIRDSESRLVELITGTPLRRNDDFVDNPLRILFERVAKTPWTQPFDEEDRSRLQILAAHLPEQEARFVARMRGLQETVGGIVATEPPETRNEMMGRARALHESAENRATHVELLIRSSFREVGLPVPDPLPAGLVERIGKSCAGLLAFEHHIYGKVGHTHVNVDEAKIRNAVWDRLIAFNIGQSIGHWPLLLVADDGVFTEVAQAAGRRDRVATLAVYEQWLS